jgi:Mor family transcriptional regulator
MGVVLMGRPRKIRSKFWLIYYRKIRGKSIEWLAHKYNVSKRTIWRHLK